MLPHLSRHPVQGDPSSPPEDRPRGSPDRTFQQSHSVAFG